MPGKLFVIAALMLATTTAAHAEGNRTSTGNGNGNRGVLNGNLNGNNIASRSQARSSARNTSTQSYEGYQGIDGSGNSSNNNTFKERLQAPGIAAPGLTSGGSTCAGSWGLGLSGPGAGFSFGNTYEMRGCESRANAMLLHQWGYRKAAVQLLVNESPSINRAMVDVGSARRR